MNASKEEAKQARERVESVLSRIGRGSLNYNSLLPVLEFLNTAERKLPSEKSYEREKQRKRTKKEEPKSIEAGDCVTIEGFGEKLFRVLFLYSEKDTSTAEIEGYGEAKISDLKRVASYAS